MTTYQRLGDYIREVNVRNRELKVTNLLGLSMSKQFRPSTSNIVGVDLTKYKVVDRNVFAFDPMSVIRVHKVPIAINDTNDPIIVSPAYYTFEVIDSFQLLPQYFKGLNLTDMPTLNLMQLFVEVMIGMNFVILQYISPPSLVNAKS